MSSAQGHEVSTVSRILDGNIFAAQPNNRLQRVIVIPYQHLIELEHLVEDDE